MYLFINTSDANYIELALFDRQANFLKRKKIKAPYRQSEKLLPAIEQMVGHKKQQLEGIVAIKGPGSFTGLRVGLSAANVLGWSLQIPVVGISFNRADLKGQLLEVVPTKNKKFKPVMPEYGREPNISVSNK